MPQRYRRATKTHKKWKRSLLAAALLSGLMAGPARGQQYQYLPPDRASTPFQMPAVQRSTSAQPQFATQSTARGSWQLASATSEDTVKLQVYNVPSELVGVVGAQLRVQFHENAQVSVTTEPNTGQLMIMAPASVHQQIGAQVSALLKAVNVGTNDKGMNLASTRQRSYILRNLSWRELEDAIRALAGSRLTVTTELNGDLANLQMTNASGMRDVLQIDRRENRVTFLGSGPSVNAWGQVVYTLDEGQVDPNHPTHIVPLAPAEPRRVKAAIQLVKATAYQTVIGAQTEAQVEIGDNQTATAMGTLDSLGANSGLFGDVQIEFIEEIDLVIIRGSKRDVQRTLEVIEKIKEQASQTQPEVEVFQLQHANAEAVADLVTQLYEAIYEARQGSVSITALGQPNALLLIGRKEVIASVKDLVSKIDQPLAPGDQLKVIRLKHASSVDLEERIRSFFTQNPPDGDQRIGLGTRVKVLADYRTNALIVQASPREMVEVEELIDQLDVEDTTTENTVKVFRLQNTLAEDLQTIIEDVIGGQTTGADESLATPPSGRLSIVTVDGNKVESGILAGVIVTADTTNNALVVRAPAPSMTLIEKLIDELDKSPSAEAVIKVFQLKNGDATTLAQTLQGLFGLAVTAGQGAQNSFVSSLSVSNLTGGGESSLIQLQIAPEARTNSVIVSGSRSDLKVIEALVLRLDEDVVESRRAEVVWLQNATASNVATALSDYFTSLAQAQSQLNTGITQILSQQELLNRQVFVVPEANTNSVLVSAGPDYFETAMRLIERLDRRPPMVAVQVLVAEVQLGDSFELGAEWGLQDGLLFDRRSATGGTLSSPVFNLGNVLTGPSTALGMTQNVAGQAMSSFGVGRANPDGDGGLVLSASSETVGVLIRALQTADRIQILNRPQLTTLDSQVATAQVGQSVPRVVGISQATVGIPQTITTEDEDVGLLLSVLPRVSPDGLILMQVGVENSKVGDPNTGIPIGFGANGEVIRSPIIDRTRAETTVSAYSGQTVVFAGLIRKDRATFRRQIPFLGSLPIVGAAFRYDVETEERRELMVVLTPRLIQTDEDYEALKQVETSRMSWCLADVLNAHGDVGLSEGNGLWGPAKSTLIYPDRAPALLDSQAFPNTGGLPVVPQSSGNFPVPDSYPMGQGDSSIIESPQAARLDLGQARNIQPSVFQEASYVTPARTQPASFENPVGVQQGAYR